MKGFFKLLRRDSVLVWSFWATLVCVVLMIAAILVSYTNLPPFVPLYNHMPWGFARLGRVYELFILPILILILCATNTTLGLRLLGKNTLLARFLFLTMVSLAVFTFIFIMRLIFITI